MSNKGTQIIALPNPFMDFALPSEAERHAVWEAELVRRFESGESLSVGDRRIARKLIRAIAAKAVA